jgi:hypothetical protein
MEALVFCRCLHSIVAHENGGCAEARCECRQSRYSVIDQELDRLKKEHGRSLRSSTIQRTAAN